MRISKSIATFSTFLNKNRDEICETAVKVTNTPIRYHSADIDYILVFLRDLVKNKQVELSEKYLLTPKGRVLIGLSGNEPIINSIIPVVSALYSGNNVTVKPSLSTLSVTKLIVKLLFKSKISRTRLDMKYAGKDDVWKLVKQADFVLWLGSYKTCTAIGKICTEFEKKFYLESEGNDVAIIDDTATDLKSVAKLIVKDVAVHNGQRCQAIRGIYLHEKVAKNFKLALNAEVKRLKIGNPMDFDTELSKGTTFRIKRFSKLPGFEPCIWIKVYENEMQMIKGLKKNEYGLALSIFTTRDYKYIKKKIIANVRFSRININKTPGDIAPNEPWGGIKKSGMYGPEPWVNKFVNRTYINK